MSLAVADAVADGVVVLGAFLCQLGLLRQGRQKTAARRAMERGPARSSLHYRSLKCHRAMSAPPAREKNSAVAATVNQPVNRTVSVDVYDPQSVE